MLRWLIVLLLVTVAGCGPAAEPPTSQTTRDAKYDKKVQKKMRKLLK